MGIHLGGLSSGNDYQTMVDQMMEAQRIPIQSKQKDLDELDYDMGAWAELRTLSQDLSRSLGTLRDFELWRDMYVDSTDESAVTATAATAAAEQVYTVIVSNRAVAQSLSSSALDTSTDLISAGYVAEGDIFEIEGQEITIEADETLESLRTKINNAAEEMSDDSRVRATIIDDRLVLNREKTGSASVALSDVSGTALQGLGIIDGVGGLVNENVAGDDARFTVNGIAITRSSNTELTDVVEGLTMSLRDTGATTLTVRPDREAAKKAILDFVEKYNAFADQVDSYSGISLAESSELAQKGELYGDSMITAIETRIRQYATSVKSPALNEGNAAYSDDGVPGVMDCLNDIGIWTVGEKNQLEVLDEDKLEERLEYDFKLVEQLFKGTYDSEEIAYTNGIASDFYKYINRVSEAMTGDIDERIDALTKKYDGLANEISDLEDGLAKYEQDQWDIFTKMEDALSQMKSQLDYISSMFGTK